MSSLQLTRHQQSLVNHSDEHALCIAVPGSGKTTTLVHRVKALLGFGAEAQRIMVMMFNKSAQIDFSQKLQRLCSEHGRLPEIRTYHSTGLRLLKSLEKWGLRAPYNSAPLSDREIELKIKDLLLQKASEGIKDRIRSDQARYIEAAIGFIDAVKSSLTSPDLQFEQSGLPGDFNFFIELFDDFEQWRHDQRAITFTDMLYDPVRLVESNREILPRIANRMDWIIVDEYQDTSTLQHRLTQIIAGSRARIMAVGDPDQTIYEFAGANIHNILSHFEDDFGRTGNINRLTMPHTFRYGHSIALAASHLISQNRARRDVVCISHPEIPPSTIELRHCEKNDTNDVITAIRQHIQETGGKEPLAVLVRVWAQAVPIELSLLELGIAYFSDGPSLFDRPEIAALVAVLELASGKLAVMSEHDRLLRLKKILTLPHVGVKSMWVNQIVEQLKALNQGFGKALANCSEHINPISDYQLNKLKERARVLQYLEKSASSQNAAEVLKTYILQTEFRESLESMSLNEQRTQEQLLAVDGLLSWLKGLDHSVHDGCHHIQELRQKRQAPAKQRHRQKETILLSSCHKAKGLEWPVVFLPGLTTRYWPFIRDDDLATQSENTLEAERRLLYVAMTRARRKLVLFTSKTSNGLSDEDWAADSRQTISPLLNEMQLSVTTQLAKALHGNDDQALKTIFSTNGLTAASRSYLKQARPGLSRDIDAAPSIEELREESKVKKAGRYRYSGSEHDRSRQTDRKKPQPDYTAPWQAKARVRHSIFGDGRVSEVNDSSFVISFDNHHGVKRFARREEVRHLFKLLATE
ncbi:MAG: ATP-dependent helicase [Endozoicomonas sp.]